jgi:choline dehydrogenase
VSTLRFDYVIVGGGSSACVAASRLVSEFQARVLILEAGPRRGPSLIDMPAGYMKYLARDDLLTMHHTVPQPQLGGRAPIIPQARILGGGSAVNAMVYMRGQAADYDGWARLTGDPGWSYESLLPYFIRQECNDVLAAPYHGADGPLQVSHLGHHCEVSRAFVKAAQERGIPFNPDFNGARQMGAGFMQHTIDPRARKRSSAVRAFLAPVLKNPRLTVETGAQVTALRIENGRAVGVDYIQDGQTRQAFADAEVLLAAGTYQTPKLLMLAGIGPAAHLAGHAIPVRVDLPGVGANLQDHHEAPIVARASGRHGYYGQDRGLAMLRHGLQYLLFGTGLVTTTGVEACAFIDPDAGGANASLQLYCVPTVYLDRDVTGLPTTHGVTLNPCLLRPKSRGLITLRSADPLALPLVDCNFFGDQDDLRLTIAGLRVARDLLKTEPLASLIAGELYPGADVMSDDDLAAHCRRTVKTNYHPVGTCRMGRDDDPDAVLDTRLRVRGINGLRVIDASLMPRLVSGNTNAPVMAVADRAVDLIAGRAPSATVRPDVAMPANMLTNA